MLEPDCVAAIAEGLTDCLHDHCDLSTAPEFQLIFLSQPPRQRTLTYLTVHEKVWREWAIKGRPPAVVSAEECTDLLVSTVAGWLPDLGWQPDATLVGCSLMYDEPAAAATGAAGVVTATRVLIARDTDGRLYHATSPAGSGDTAVAVRDEAPGGRIAAIAEALTTILDNRVVAVFQLPTTGYILLRTVHPDGHNPYTVETFIDCAAVMDDAAATARAQAEATPLHSAPSNVVHTLRLVHRTDAGDRDIWTSDPLRGSGPPLP